MSGGSNHTGPDWPSAEALRTKLPIPYEELVSFDDALMGYVMARASDSSHVDVATAEQGLAVLLAACERAVEEIGSAVPPAQLRALLIIGQEGSMNLNRLARALDSTPSATSRLTDRMQMAGLLTRDRAAASRREIVLVPSESGLQLAEWVRTQRRAALGEVLAMMSPDARDALARGLSELATGTN